MTASLHPGALVAAFGASLGKPRWFRLLELHVCAGTDSAM
jgi:hypothetical protein